MNTSRVGIIGCGNISPVYANTLTEFPWIEIAAFADGIPSAPRKFAERYGGVVLELADMLADDSIDAVVNLTPAHAHTSVSRGVSRQANLCSARSRSARTSTKVARWSISPCEKNLRLGCAPDTFLGAGLQAARTAIDRGMIGEPIAANGFMWAWGPSGGIPTPRGSTGPGAGPLFDMGPYYLTAFVHLLGPARSISGSAKIGIADRVMHAKGRVGDVVQATMPTHVSSMIEFVSGASATLVTSFDVKATRLRNIEIYGTEGTLALPDPNTFGGPLKVRSILADDWRDIPLPTPNIPQQRGIGLADMLSATTANRPHRASAELALHVLELMSSTLRSSDEGRRLDLTTTCERPAPMRFNLPANTFDD